MRKYTYQTKPDGNGERTTVRTCQEHLGISMQAFPRPHYEPVVETDPGVECDVCFYFAWLTEHDAALAVETEGRNR